MKANQMKKQLNREKSVAVTVVFIIGRHNIPMQFTATFIAKHYVNVSVLIKFSQKTSVFTLLIITCVQWNLQKRLHLFFVAFSLHDLEMTNHTRKNLTVAKVKLLPWKHMT